MSLLILTDTHFGVRNDSGIFREYFKKYFDETFFPFVMENNVKKILHAGDLWDRRKYVNFETLNYFRRNFFEPLENMGIEMDVIVGNHDTSYKDTSRVNSVEELCGHYANIRIFQEATEVEYDGVKVLLVPWINQENYDQSMNLIQTTDAKYLIGHLELQGFYMNKTQRSDTGFSRDIFKKFDAVYSGHYHHQSTEDNVTFLGALFEINFSDINDPRGFHIWEPITNELVFHKNPLKMHYRIFYDDKDKDLGVLLKKVTDKLTNTYVKVVVQNKTNPYNFEKFLEKLFSLNPADVKIEEDLTLSEGDEEMQVDTAEDTLTILNKYVDSLEIDAEKSKIKQELKLLYIEAQNMEK